MPLNAVVTDINTVDEAVRGFYSEKNGKFVLDVTSVDGFALEDVSGLKSSLSAERTSVASLTARLKPFEGLDATAAKAAIEAVGAYGDLTPEKAREAIETATRLSALDPEKEADRLAGEKFETVKGQLTNAFSEREKVLIGEVDAAKAINISLTEQLQTVMVDNVINAELAKLNPLDDARDALNLLAKQAIRSKVVDGKIVVEVVDAQGNPVISKVENGQIIHQTPEAYIASLRETKPGLFKADQIQGLNTNPTNKTGSDTSNSDPNPWAKGSINLTQQMKIGRDNPTLAKQLKAAAGVK